MKVVESFRVGAWRIEVVEPEVGGVALVLYGPRRPPIYVAPVCNGSRIEGIPKYLFKKVRGLDRFPELAFS